MRDILISLKPYYYYLIGENIKKVEVRKSYPKAEDWSRNSWFYMSRDEKSFAKIPKEFQEKYRKHFGKVGMRFVCNKIDYWQHNWKPDIMHIEDMSKLSCVSVYDLIGYSNRGNDILYALHITDLVVYDEPRELSEFEKPCEEFEFSTVYSPTIMKVRGRPRFFERPPQSWCYIEPRQTAD